jgi:bifunctional DNA-binding transcriptional regulator/antitoxin component of YhaV-PrlF toxin-antitoxin module
MTQQVSDLNEVTAQVRQRGQITVPAVLRSRYPWLRQKKRLKIIPMHDGLLVRPFEKNVELTLEEKRKKARKLLSKLRRNSKYDKDQGMSLSEFVVRDRETH